MIFEFEHDFTPICWKDNYLKAQQGTDNIGSKCVSMANLTFAVNTKHNGNLISTTSHIRNKQVLEWGRSWNTLPCYVLYLWLVLLATVRHWYSLQKTKLLILIEMDWHLKQKFAIAWCSGKTISSCILMPNSEVGLHHKSQNKTI